MVPQGQTAAVRSGRGRRAGWRGLGQARVMIRTAVRAPGAPGGIVRVVQMTAGALETARKQSVPTLLGSQSRKTRLEALRMALVVTTVWIGLGRGRDIDSHGGQNTKRARKDGENGFLLAMFAVNGRGHGQILPIFCCTPTFYCRS